MDDATKELCYSAKLAAIKAKVQMPNEEVLKFIENSLKEVKMELEQILSEKLTNDKTAETHTSEML